MIAASRARGTSLRRQIARRDFGRCAGCGLDCGQLDNDLMRLRWRDRAAWEVRCIELGITRRSRLRSTWQVDHIQPVSRGGTDALTNLRTLCLWCHQAETRLLMQRRRRGA